MTACGDIHTLLVTRDGALWVCVEGRDGQLGALGLDGETFWTGWGPPDFHRKGHSDESDGVDRGRRALDLGIRL